MNRKPTKNSGRRFVVPASAALLVLAGSPWANAQSTAGATVELEEFTVTGSHIPTTETAFDARATPVTIVTRDQIESLGYSTPTELLQNLAVNNGGSVPISNNATGFTPSASSVSLRGLGPEATLVLINGRRVAPFPIGTGGTTAFVDLNSFPMAAVDRIEVLKDGASATYGADAVAGVVNIFTRRNFNGSEATIRYGNTTEADSGEVIANLISGVSNDTTNITVGLNYYKRNAIFNSDRAYSEVPPFLSTNSSPLNFQISREAALEALMLPAGASIPGVADDASLFFASTFANRESNNGNLPATSYQFSPGRTSVYNFNETAGSYPESERMGGFLSFDRKFFGSDRVTVYGDLFYQDVRTINELAPSATGNFGNPGGVSIVIPARTDTPIGGRTLAATGAFNRFNPFNQDFSGGSRARLAEFGNRIYRDTNTALNLDLGIKVKDLFGDWSVDASAMYSRILNAQRNTLVSISRFNRLVNENDPIFDPSSSEYIGTEIPYNPFGYYRNPIANNALVAPYALVELKDRNESELSGGQMVVSTPSLFRLPGGNAGFAAGIEYRFEELIQSPDEAGRTGDVIGSSTANVTQEDREIGSVFAEIELPFVSPEQDLPGIHALSVNLSGRYEDFVSQNDDIFVPKVSFRYMPVDDSLVFRGSWGKGYRQPSMYELYASGLTFGLEPVTNPLTNVNEPEQDVTTASSRQLRAEESESLSIGVVWTPSFLSTDRSGFSISLDFWDIDRTGNVTVDHQDVVNRFFDGETLLPGESVQVDAGNQIVLVNGVFRNLGNENANGIDISASYFWVDDNLGRFDVGVNASRLDSYKIQQFPGAPFFEYVGWTDDVLFDNTTGDPAPGSGDDAYLKWKGEVYASWTKGETSARLTGSYLDGYRDFVVDWDPGAPTDPAGFRDVPSTMIWDVSLTHRFFAGSESWFGDTRVTVGVNNVFDKEPPFVESWGNNSTGYSGFLYNSEGRFVYAQLTKKF
ncbi:TonB-dependent receptor [Opitutales bacterium ASA1]|uniref:TonB-dependent receptor domain-containing protein n=1 Tax=Congregicoccus parvus TaxID=3081749 RepID=UPI002B29AC46|nr:TonB-dependent receptor [Opitutales bacterium ASA1]